VTADKTVLVVDDEEMVRHLAARMLNLQGFRALEARDAEQALRLLQRQSRRILAVVTDLSMPGLDGRGLGDVVSRCWPTIPVLYMSGFPAERRVGEVALDPRLPFIQKPFTEEQLGRKMRELLMGRAEQ
jgi:two-component system cell cycle sensor histidine kinase/response regulator CckA